MAVVEEAGTDLERALAALRRHRTLMGAPTRTVVDQLELDVASQIFIVTVLGEFKRGKSTLLNALIGQDLLPNDVTPTTAAICVLRYAAEPFLLAHWSDGREERRDLSRSSLDEFTATADFNPDDLDYLELGLPSGVLADGLVLVDTPGVNDLNEHRSEIAARFVPRSDAVVFVLSAAAPVRRTELEFLDTKVFAAGLERMLFVANFADLVDEEEREDLPRILSRRLAPAMRGYSPNITLLSASMALNAAIGHSDDLAEASGLTRLKDSIGRLVRREDRQAVRARRMLHRSRLCLESAIVDVEQGIALSQRDLGGLADELATVDAALARKADRSQKMNLWIEDRRSEILAIVRKSLLNMRDGLTEEIMELVEGHKSPILRSFSKRAFRGR